MSDDTMEALKRFEQEEGIAFPLASDSDKAIRKAYGRGRVTFLIDKEGIIRFIQKGVPNNDDFLARLRELQ